MNLGNLNERLSIALQAIDQLKSVEYKSIISEGMRSGISQLSCLKSWSTDKTDRNPLIRTMTYTYKKFPYVAKKCELLKKMPLEYIMTDARGGEVHDKRRSEKVRVSREALNWWLENGERCDEQTWEAAKFLYSIQTRKVRDYSNVSFSQIEENNSICTRGRCPTQIPLLKIMSSKEDFLYTVYEGGEISMMSDSDKRDLQVFTTKILSVVSDVDEISRYLRKLWDDKRRYIVTPQEKNPYITELRHALEGKEWKINPIGIRVGSDMEFESVKTACGVCLKNIFEGSSSGIKKMLLSNKLNRTVIFGKSLASHLSGFPNSGDISIQTCKAALGYPIVKAVMHNGIKFTKIEELKLSDFFDKNLADQILVTRSRSGTVKTIAYTQKVNSQYRTYTETKTKTYPIKMENSKYHLNAWKNSSAVVSVFCGKLISITVFCKSADSIKRIIASAITYLRLFPDMTVISDTIQNKSVDRALYEYFLDPKNWPMTPSILGKRKEGQITVRGIPLFKELVISDKEGGTPVSQLYKSIVSDDDLSVSIIESRGAETFEQQIISKEAITNYIQIKNKDNRLDCFPYGTEELETYVLQKMGLEQTWVTLSYEVFLKFLSYKKEGKLTDWQLTASLRNSIMIHISFNEKNILSLNRLTAEYEEKMNKGFFGGNDKSIFGYVLLEVLRRNLVKGEGGTKLLSVWLSQSKEYHLNFIDDRRGKNRGRKDTILVIPSFNSGDLIVDHCGNFLAYHEPVFSLSDHKIIKKDFYMDSIVLKPCPNFPCSLSKNFREERTIQCTEGTHLKFYDSCFIIHYENNQIKVLNSHYDQICANQFILQTTLDIQARQESDDYSTLLENYKRARIQEVQDNQY